MGIIDGHQHVNVGLDRLTTRRLLLLSSTDLLRYQIEAVVILPPGLHARSGVDPCAETVPLQEFSHWRWPMGPCDWDLYVASPGHRFYDLVLLGLLTLNVARLLHTSCRGAGSL